MSKEKEKHITSGIKSKSRRNKKKEKQKWQSKDVKQMGNTRLRRISRHR